MLSPWWTSENVSFALAQLKVVSFAQNECVKLLFSKSICTKRWRLGTRPRTHMLFSRRPVFASGCENATIDYCSPPKLPSPPCVSHKRNCSFSFPQKFNTCSICISSLKHASQFPRRRISFLLFDICALRGATEKLHFDWLRRILMEILATLRNRFNTLHLYLQV